MSNDNADRVYWEERAMTADREVVRLKEVIKRAEFSSTEYSHSCPWCSTLLASLHKIDCAAFTVDGEVK